MSGRENGACMGSSSPVLRTASADDAPAESLETRVETRVLHEVVSRLAVVRIRLALRQPKGSRAPPKSEVVRQALLRGLKSLEDELDADNDNDNSTPPVDAPRPAPVPKKKPRINP